MALRAYVPPVLAIAFAFLIVHFWERFPLPSVTLAFYNIDLVGTLPILVFSLFSLVFCKAYAYKTILGRTPIMLIAGMAMSTALLIISMAIHTPLLIYSNGVDLTLPLILLLVLWMIFLGQKKGLLEIIISSFAMVGAPLLIIDVFFLFLLPLSFQIPFGAAILGGVGLKDGLNMAIFCMLSLSAILFFPNLLKSTEKQ
jgi:hypothetical protein